MEIIEFSGVEMALGVLFLFLLLALAIGFLPRLHKAAESKQKGTDLFTGSFGRLGPIL